MNNIYSEIKENTIAGEITGVSRSLRPQTIKEMNRTNIAVKTHE